MLESLYRVRGGAVDFRTLSLQPRPVPRRQRLPVGLRASRRRRAVAQGRAVGAVIDGKLYLILLDAARSHYYDADAARLRSDRRFGRAAAASRPARSAPARGRCPATAARARRCPGPAAVFPAAASSAGPAGLGSARVAAAASRGLVGCCCICGSPCEPQRRAPLRVARPAMPAIGRAPFRRRARVAELVDALDLGSSIERCGGSSPSARTIRCRSVESPQAEIHSGL